MDDTAGDQDNCYRSEGSIAVRRGTHTMRRSEPRHPDRGMAMELEVISPSANGEIEKFGGTMEIMPPIPTIEGNWREKKFISIPNRKKVILLSILSTIVTVALSVGSLYVLTYFDHNIRFEKGLIPSTVIPLLIAPIVSYFTLNQSFLLTMAAAEVEALSRTDALTGLKNKRFFLELVEREIYIANRYDINASLLLIDLDYFKKVNDQYGHLAGDQALKVVSSIIQDNVRGCDIVGRFGGEEIIVFLAHAPYEQAIEIAERIRKAISETAILFSGERIFVTASIGVSSTEAGIDNLMQLVHVADFAMYEAKSTGRDRVSYAISTSKEVGF
jgi:diguanylate cyclase (GGDEF)-like protein